jgi:hypothetical protein
VNKKPSILKSLSGALLLLLYLAGTIGVEWLHEKIHDSVEAELHFPEAEQNTCHLALYNQAADCGHDQHITQDNDCDHCQILNHQIHDFQDAVSFCISIDEETHYTVYHCSVFHTVAVYQQLRGPPAVG